MRKAAKSRYVSLVLDAPVPAAVPEPSAPAAPHSLFVVESTPPAPEPARPERRWRAPGAQVGIAAQIADALGEKSYTARQQIDKFIWLLGPDQALEMCQRAQEIEESGGMLINSDKRKRTVGGVFFWLCVTAGVARPGYEEELSYTRQHRRPPRARRAS